MLIIDFSLSEGKELWCSCEKNCHTFPELTNHYSSFFLPDHWLPDPGLHGHCPDSGAPAVLHDAG